jgi:hypothetical protein
MNAIGGLIVSGSQEEVMPLSGWGGFFHGAALALEPEGAGQKPFDSQDFSVW